MAEPNVEGLECRPVTTERWDDLVRLFEHHGNPGYCWCMRWRASSAEFQKLGANGRRAALQRLVDGGTPTGIIACLDGRPVGWCSVAPRETYLALERSKTLKRIDDAIIWSVVCFFVDRTVRGRQVSQDLLRAAVRHAVERGAQVVDGYPVEPGAHGYRFMGLASTFEKAGFHDATPPGAVRRTMRHVVGSEEPAVVDGISTRRIG